MPCKKHVPFLVHEFCGICTSLYFSEGCLFILKRVQNFISIAVILLKIENVNMLAGILEEKLITQLERQILFAAS